MGLSLDTPINYDIPFVKTCITQLPVVFGELSSISLAGVLERRFLVSIATCKLWLRGAIIVFLGMIWDTDGCWINYTLYSQVMPFQRALGLSQLQARDGWTVFSPDLKILWLRLLMIDPIFGIQQYDTSTVFLLKSCDMDVQRVNVGQEVRKKRLPMLVFVK